MNRSETALLLGLAAARDRRTVGEADVMAWAQDLADVDFADAREAVARHFRQSTEWLLPAHVRALVRIIRDERRRLQSAVPALPGPFEPDNARAERAARGAALCRQVLAEHAPPEPEPERPLDESGRIRLAALARARGERRERRTDPAPLARIAGATLHQIRSTDR